MCGFGLAMGHHQQVGNRSGPRSGCIEAGIQTLSGIIANPLLLEGREIGRTSYSTFKDKETIFTVLCEI